MSNDKHKKQKAKMWTNKYVRENKQTKTETNARYISGKYGFKQIKAGYFVTLQ